jgi:hypothetical protein
VKIERKLLLATLEPLKAALSQGNQPSYRRFWFDGKHVSAHDGGVGVRIALATPFKLGVEGALMLSLLNQLTGNEVQLDDKEDHLVIRTGKTGGTKLATMDIKGRLWPYPEHLGDAEDTGRAVASMKVTEAFVSALRQVMVVRPSKPRRTEHYSVCIYPVKEGADLYTTDSHVLAVMGISEFIDGDAKVIALPRAIAELVASRGGRGTTLYQYPDHFFTQATERMEFYCNVLDTTNLMDLPMLVYRHYDSQDVPEMDIPEEFNAALERACLLAEKEPVVKLQLEGKTLTVSAVGKRGEMDETFKMSKEVPKASMNFVASEFLKAGAVTRMQLTPTSLNLIGKNGFVYILAPHGSEPQG